MMASPGLLPISNDQFMADVHALSALIAADNWRPDFIVGIGRGGLVPAVYLSHATGIALLSVDHSSQVPSFGAELLTRLASKSCAGVRLLIVDDINDSGRTLAHLRASLAAAGGAMDHIRVAVLIDNVSSSQSVDYRARRIDRKTETRWFVFPWEAMAADDAVLAEAAEMHRAVGSRE